MHQEQGSPPMDVPTQPRATAAFAALLRRRIAHCRAKKQLESSQQLDALERKLPDASSKSLRGTQTVSLKARVTRKCGLACADVCRGAAVQPCTGGGWPKGLRVVAYKQALRPPQPKASTTFFYHPASTRAERAARVDVWRLHGRDTAHSMLPQRHQVPKVFRMLRKQGLSAATKM